MDTRQPYPFASPSRVDSPMVALAQQQDPDANGAGKTVTLNYVPFGSILIPVYAAAGFTRQDFDQSPTAGSQDGGTAGDPNDDPRPWDVSLSATNQATSLLSAAAYWQLRWWVKGAAYQTPIRVLDPAPNTKKNGQVVLASRVQVLLWGITNQAAGVVQPQQWTVGIAPSPGVSLGAERFNWQWGTALAANFAASACNVQDGAFPGGTGNTFQQSGCVGQFKVTLVTNPGGTLLYPMLVDNGVYVEGSTLNAVQNIGDAQSYGDEFRPGTVSFGGRGNTLTKLQVALSTIPNAFAAPAQAATAHALVKVGT